MNTAVFHSHSSTMLSKHKLWVSSGKITRVTKFLVMFLSDPGKQSSWNVRNESLEVQLCIRKVRSFVLEPEASYSDCVCVFFFPSSWSVHAEKCWNNDFRYSTTASYSVFPISSFKFSVLLRYALIQFHMRTRSIGYTDKDDIRTAGSLKHVRPTAVQLPSEISMKNILSFLFCAPSRLQWTPRH